jgi:hypothetical protein
MHLPWLFIGGHLMKKSWALLGEISEGLVQYRKIKEERRLLS